MAARELVLETEIGAERHSALELLLTLGALVDLLKLFEHLLGAFFQVVVLLPALVILVMYFFR